MSGLGPSDDTSSPLVNFEVPRQGDTLSGTVNITIEAFGDDGVLGIFVDGVLSTEDPSAPYQGLRNTGSGADPISRTLRAEARE